MAKSALILDFGGVVTQTLFEIHAVTERNLGLPPGTLTWMGPLAPETDELWQRVRRGEITEGVYWRTRAGEIGRLVGESWYDARDILDRVLATEPNAIVRPEAVRAVRKLRKMGIRVAVLSNELDRFYGPDFRSRLEIVAELDALVDGTHTNVMKPDPRAYALCLHALGVDASGALFVDDSPRNVEGARAAGIEALHFDIRAPAACFARIEDAFTAR